MSSTISTPVSSSTSAPEDDELARLATTYLAGLPEHRQRAILAEARRKRARLSSIPWYANKARNGGEEYWLRSAISYMGED